MLLVDLIEFFMQSRARIPDVANIITINHKHCHGVTGLVFVVLLRVYCIGEEKTDNSILLCLVEVNKTYHS